MTQFAFKERLDSILMCLQDLNSIMTHFKNISNYMSQKLLFDLNSNGSYISLQIRDAHQSLFVGFFTSFFSISMKQSYHWIDILFHCMNLSGFKRCSSTKTTVKDFFEDKDAI